MAFRRLLLLHPDRNSTGEIPPAGRTPTASNHGHIRGSISKWALSISNSSLFFFSLPLLLFFSPSLPPSNSRPILRCGCKLPTQSSGAPTIASPISPLEPLLYFTSFFPPSLSKPEIGRLRQAAGCTKSSPSVLPMPTYSNSSYFFYFPPLLPSYLVLSSSSFFFIPKLEAGRRIMLFWCVRSTAFSPSS